MRAGVAALTKLAESVLPALPGGEMPTHAPAILGHCAELLRYVLSLSILDAL
eukprot:COSAG05_NODE_182_length_14772_cov_42.430655_2_plen_52_part_00